MSVHPLSVELTPSVPNLLRSFIDNALAALAPSDRVTAHAVRGGVRIEALWEPDLEAAVGAVKQATTAQVHFSKPEIRYILEPELLEPVLFVCVTTPEDYIGDVIGDLNRRRGLITDMVDSSQGKVISVHVPLSEVFGYMSVLRGMTHGRATVTASFLNYQPVPNFGPGPDDNEPMSVALHA